jgi:hypothetical protein
VLDRKVSAAAARGAYGVVVTADGRQVDDMATKQCRESLRETRGPIDWTFDRGGDRREA